jgi:hypothetical protein
MYGRTSGRFGRAFGYIGEIWRNQERLERTLHLPWICHVRVCFKLVLTPKGRRVFLAKIASKQPLLIARWSVQTEELF